MDEKQSSEQSSKRDSRINHDLLPGIRIKGDHESESFESPSSSSSMTSPSLSGSTTSNLSSSRPSHSRSRSVNLSPTLQAGSSFSPGAIRWDPYGADSALRNAVAAHQSSMNGNNGPAHLHHQLQNASSANSNVSKLQPTSPIYVKVLAPSPTNTSAPEDLLRRAASVGSVNNEGLYINNGNGSLNIDLSSSAISTSPETRRPSHLNARAMEKSSSGGSASFSPRSPRSPHHTNDYAARTASPSRAYAIPMSPRLQALGSGSGHIRRSSNSSVEGIPRIPSPSLIGFQPGRSPQTGTNSLNTLSRSPVRKEFANEVGSPTSPRINPDPELPVDSVWPSPHQHEQPLPIMSNGSEAIPLDSYYSHSTPIPPSLRDELSTHTSSGGITPVPISGPSSPGRRSPLVDWTSSVRMQRTPSPLNWGSAGRRNSQSSTAHPSVIPFPSSPLRSSSPRLAAPQPIASNSLNLANAAMQRHSRALSNSSTSSNDSDIEARDMALSHAQRNNEDHSPTHKAVSQPRATLAKVDVQNAHADVGSRSPAIRTKELENENENDQQGQMNADRRSMMQFAHFSASPQDRIRFLERKSSFERSSPSFIPRALASHRDGVEYVNGIPIRTQSPGLLAVSPSESISSSTSESPPKTRSFIGMPPRSGYELSDDPDDVGSEDGSVGSGRDSVGTNEDRDAAESEDDEDGQEEGDGREDVDLESAVGEMDEENISLNQSFIPKRPPLTFGSVVVPEPMKQSPNVVAQYWGDHGADESQQNVPYDVEADRNDEEGGQYGQIDDNEDLSGQPEENEVIHEESLTTLERIFLFAKSEMTYHRILVSHSLSDWILEVELNEAVEFVIPLLNGLACDVNEVCTAFAPQLHRLMWYFFRNCPLAEQKRIQQENNEQDVTLIEPLEKSKEEEHEERATRPTLSISTFTPLLCALLLNSNATIANATQASIVFFFARLQGFSLHGDVFELDEDLSRVQQPQIGPGSQSQRRQTFDHNTTLVKDAAAREDKRVLLEDYQFDIESRMKVMDELLEHVALAIGHLTHEQPDSSVKQIDENPSGALMDFSEEEISSKETLGELDGEKKMDDDTPYPVVAEIQEKGVDEAEDKGVTLPNEQEVSIKTIDNDDPSLTINADGESDQSGKPNGEETGQDYEMDQVFNSLESQSDEQRDFYESQADEEIMTWASSDDLEEGLGDTAMASIDGASITMSIEEEVAVGRMASVSLLAAIGTEGLIENQFLLQKVLPELITSASDRTFFVRKEAAVAIGTLARAIGYEQIREQELISIFTRLCQDNIWHVRQAACLSVPELFAQVTDLSERRNKLMEVMSAFVNDVSRNVRVAALDIIGEIIYLFHNDPDGVPDELVRHFLGKPWGGEEERKQDNLNVPLESSLNNQEDSESNNLEELQPDHIPSTSWSNSSDSSESMSAATWRINDAFGGHLHGDLSFDAFNADPDRPLVMAYNLPAVALTLGSSKWHLLREVHRKLSDHPSSKVRRSLAASLHEIAKIIGLDAASENLNPFISQFLDPRFEQDGEVKMALLENIDVTLSNMHLDKGLEALKVMQDLWNDPEMYGMGARFPNHWRMRQKLISKISTLASRFLLEDDQGILVMLMQSALMDSVSAVRAEGVNAVSALYHLFAEQDQVLADGFLGMLVDVSDSDDSGYRARVATLQSIAQLCRNQIQRSSIEMLAMPRLVELSKDEIVDVRFALAALMQLMCSMDGLYALPQSRSEGVMKILRRLGRDESSLVRETVENAVGVDYLAELGAASPLAPRPVRELVLGPVDGGPHKPISSFEDAMTIVNESNNGDEDGENDDRTQPFAMDDEDESNNMENNLSQEGQSDGQTGAKNAFSNRNNASSEEDGERKPAPSLANSTLARRRIAHLNNNATAVGREELRPAQYYPSALHNQAMSLDDEGDEEMIVIPSEENALLLSAHLPSDHANSSHALSTPLTSAISDRDEDESEGEDELPHHLLSVGDKSTPVKDARETIGGANRLQTLRLQGDLSQNGIPFSLESPERAFNLQGNQTDVGKNVNVEENAAGTALPQDPFLAFVAGHHFVDRSTGMNALKDEDKDGNQNDRRTPDVPLSPAQQRSAFDDDEDDEEE